MSLSVKAAIVRQYNLLYAATLVKLDARAFGMTLELLLARKRLDHTRDHGEAYRLVLGEFG